VCFIWLYILFACLIHGTRENFHGTRYMLKLFETLESRTRFKEFFRDPFKLFQITCKFILISKSLEQYKIFSFRDNDYENKLFMIMMIVNFMHIEW
jgi:hypothetical protein